MQLRMVLPITALFALASGCADELVPGEVPDGGDNNPPPQNDGGFPSVSGAFTHELGDGSVVTTVVNASDTEVYQHLDLDTALSTTDAARWDLAFSRFHVRMNGGASGSAGVQVAALHEASFESVTKAPEEGWTSPVTDGPDDDDAEPDNAFNNGTDDWYAYDLSTHTLTAKDVTYVVASSAGRFYKIRFESYYDGAGSPGFVRFRWAEIEAPDSALPDAGVFVPMDGGVDTPDGSAPPDGGVDGSVEPEPEVIPEDALTVDATSTDVWVYLSAASGVVAAPAEPATDLGWDLAISGFDLRTNSGTSGSGMGGALLDESGLPYADITTSPTTGFIADTLGARGYPPGLPDTDRNEVLAEWWDYDFMTHSVSAGPRTYLVRTASGGYAKLRIWQYTAGLLKLSFEAL